MKYLGLLFILAQLAVNLWGLMLVAGLYWRNRWFALVAGPILGVTVMFAIECYHGLGPALLPMGLLCTVLSGALVGFSMSGWVPTRIGERWGALLAEWRAEFAPPRLVGCFGVFWFIFLYALAWRYTNPNLYGGSEAPADFSFICSYYSGTTIPVVDAWYYPFPSTQYYSFQHYAAALMGRLLVLPGERPITLGSASSSRWRGRPIPGPSSSWPGEFGCGPCSSRRCLWGAPEWCRWPTSRKKQSRR